MADEEKNKQDINDAEGKFAEDTEVLENTESEGSADASEDTNAAENTETSESTEDLEDDEEPETTSEKKKMKLLIGGAIGILSLAVVVLGGCVIYSHSMNSKLAVKAAALQENNETLKANLEEAITKLKSTPTPIPTPEVTDTPTPEPTPEGPAVIENNFDAVEQQTQSQPQEPQVIVDENGEEKVITNPENPLPEYIKYENFVGGKKFSFEYPSSWDGRVVFANVTNEDGSMVVTCYQSGQYADFQAGAAENGEIFHILVNQDAAYHSELNNQYKISQSDTYCAYYEEPSGVTYDYVNHGEYAADYKLVYESQTRIWRTFSFH